MVQNKIMGARNMRNSAELPFEKHWCATKVKDTKRCYTLALTVEAPRKTGAPVASSRMDNTMVLDDHQALVKELVEVRPMYS